MSPASRTYPRPSAIGQVQGYDDRYQAVLFACCDPGAFTRRGDNYEEGLESWQARAVEIALDLFAARVSVSGGEGQ